MNISLNISPSKKLSNFKVQTNKVNSRKINSSILYQDKVVISEEGRAATVGASSKDAQADFLGSEEQTDGTEGGTFVSETETSSKLEDIPEEWIDITDQIKREASSTYDLTDSERWVVYKPNPKQYKRYFQDTFLLRDPQMADITRQTNAASERLIDSYFNGGVNDEAFKQGFQTLARSFFKACDDNKYPHNFPFITIQDNQAMMETFYSEFRRKVLTAAVKKNQAEGKQYITGEMNMQREYKYYNSDYYYQSEAAISAITDGILEIVDERGASDYFSLPDYQEEKLWCYYNFNSALSNPMNVCEQTFTDLSQVPPKNFKWFYQSGGDANKGPHSHVIRGSSWAVDRYGNITDYRPAVLPTKFDWEDSATATMWASIQDENGKTQFITTDLFYQFSKSDLYTVSSLMKFQEGSSYTVKMANHFFNTMQVYRKEYFILL